MSWFYRIAGSVALLALAACTGSSATVSLTSTVQQAATAANAIILEPLPLPTLSAATLIPASTIAPSPATPLTRDVTEFPDPQAYAWELLVDGLERPVAIAAPRDGTGRLFVVEQRGIVRIYHDGMLLPEPFLDIQKRVGSRGNEQGLLGLAFHPDYSQNRLFYVNYTDRNGDTVIAEFSASGDVANRADAGSERQLILIRQPYPNHNGGSVVFGPDGYLYLGLGDGGSAGDPHGNAQSFNTWLGKILRIDVDGGEPYAIPAGNPFVQTAVAEIWAYGLRNPWRFSFDRLTGDLYIADVGQNTWEEVNFLPEGSLPGANFGWNYREGLHPYEGKPQAGSVLVDPVAEYDHGLGCSVTGGYVYRGEALPNWQGIYLYGDFCSGKIWGLMREAGGGWKNQVLFETRLNLSSFGEDDAGELYLSDLNGGVYRLQAKP